jgi:hypothetical protein
MAMSQRLYGYDSQSGLTKVWHEDGEGNWAVQYIQNNDILLDANKEASNHCDPYNADKSMRHVARIPYSVIYKWLADYGIDYFNPDHQEAVDRLLDSNEWRYLRVDGASGRSVLLNSDGSPMFARGVE